MPRFWPLLVIFSFSCHADGVSEALQGLGLKNPRPAGATLLQNQNLVGSSKTQRLVIFETPQHERFEIKTIQPLEAAAAAELLDSENKGIQKLFKPAQTPYMGDIAEAIGGCPARFDPVALKVPLLREARPALIAAADSTFTFGACTEAKAKYKGALVSWYDAGSRTLWSWRVFVPRAPKQKETDSSWLAPLLARFSH